MGEHSGAAIKEANAHLRRRSYQAGLAEGIRQGRVKALRDMAEWHDGQARKWQNKRKRGSANGQYCGALRDEHKWSATHFREQAKEKEGE